MYVLFLPADKIKCRSVFSSPARNFMQITWFPYWKYCVLEPFEGTKQKDRNVYGQSPVTKRKPGHSTHMFQYLQ